MSKSSVSLSVGPSLPVLLFLVFLILKLTDVIGWSWWWVTAPLWVGAIISIGILASVVTFMLLTVGRLVGREFKEGDDQ